MAFMAAMLLAACARTPPEAALRATIGELQAAVERHDGSALQETIADDFVGPGGLDRDGARRTAQAMFLRYRDVA